MASCVYPAMQHLHLMFERPCLTDLNSTTEIISNIQKRRHLRLRLGCSEELSMTDIHHKNTHTVRVKLNIHFLIWLSLSGGIGVSESWHGMTVTPYSINTYGHQ